MMFGTYRRLALAMMATLALGGVMATGTGARAQSTVAQNFPTPGATSSPVQYQGQSFVAGTAGTNYNTIAFRFLDSGTVRPVGGTLYLFDAAYAGLPGDLPAARNDASFVASSIVTPADEFGQVYQFDFAPDVTLTGGSQYFAYSDTDFQVTLAIPEDGEPPYGSTYAGGERSFTQADWLMQPFTPDPQGADAQFQVIGNAVSTVPEPGAWLLLGGGLLGLGFVTRRRRSHPVAV